MIVKFEIPVQFGKKRYKKGTHEIKSEDERKAMKGWFFDSLVENQKAIILKKTYSKEKKLEDK